MSCEIQINQKIIETTFYVRCQMLWGLANTGPSNGSTLTMTHNVNNKYEVIYGYFIAGNCRFHNSISLQLTCLNLILS
jgi:hypothetical protein